MAGLSGLGATGGASGLPSLGGSGEGGTSSFSRIMDSMIQANASRISKMNAQSGLPTGTMGGVPGLSGVMPSTLQIESYIKGFLDKSIQVQNNQGEKLYSGVVKEMVIGQEGQYFLIVEEPNTKEKRRVKIQFHSDKISNNVPETEAPGVVSSARLGLEQFITDAVRGTASGGNGLTSSVKSFDFTSFLQQTQMQAQMANNKSMVDYEVDGEIHKGQFGYITGDSVHLKDGTPLQLQFEEVEA